MKFEMMKNVSKVIKIKVLLTFGFIFLFLNFAYGQKTSSDIKQVDFKKTFNSKTKSFLRITYGDLTGDKSEEAIILLRNQEIRKPNLDEIVVYSIKNGKVVKLADFAPGRRGSYVLSIKSLENNFKIEEKIFVLDLAILRTGEYVPARYYTIKYRWNGFQMEETERSCLKLLPENVREIG
ncbi:hypothetical protein BH20ACI1_BH20ACI1_14350 [soil metagenome]